MKARPATRTRRAESPTDVYTGSLLPAIAVAQRVRPLTRSLLDAAVGPQEIEHRLNRPAGGTLRFVLIGSQPEETPQVGAYAVLAEVGLQLNAVVVDTAALAGRIADTLKLLALESGAFVGCEVSADTDNAYRHFVVVLLDVAHVPKAVISNIACVAASSK